MEKPPFKEAFWFWLKLGFISFGGTAGQIAIMHEFLAAPIIEKTRDNEKIKQALGIVTATVVGVIINLTIYLGKAVVFPDELLLSQIDYLTLGWIVISFIAMYRFKINMMTWIIVSALFGLASYFFS